jgi:hypothetical protein
MDHYVFLTMELESMYIHRSTVLLHCNNKWPPCTGRRLQEALYISIKMFRRTVAGVARSESWSMSFRIRCLRRWSDEMLV